MMFGTNTGAPDDNIAHNDQPAPHNPPMNQNVQEPPNEADWVELVDQPTFPANDAQATNDNGNENSGASGDGDGDGDDDGDDDDDDGFFEAAAAAVAVTDGSS
eukprot:c5721_g1_i2.p2 GENE.c5721_g1_i2~~c5721_g1_i2.p2  ORF type:complete len:103 (+),score=38.30 c5721_g1_i2:97-405(+)